MGSKTQKDPKVQLDLLHKTLPLPFTVAFFFKMCESLCGKY